MKDGGVFISNSGCSVLFPEVPNADWEQLKEARANGNIGRSGADGGTALCVTIVHCMTMMDSALQLLKLLVHVAIYGHESSVSILLCIVLYNNGNVHYCCYNNNYDYY